MNSITQVQQDLLGRMEQMKQGAEGPVLEASTLFDASGLEGGPAPKDGFRTAFGEIFTAIDNQHHKAGALTAAVDSGASDDLVGAMIESQKASVSFSALMQVRNKVTSAFEEIMRTPL